MVKGIYIPVDESLPIELREFNGLEDYMNAVDGLIEAVDIDRPDATMFVNEEGKIHGLDVNRRACLLLWVHNSRYRGLGSIEGNVVLVGQPDDEGNTLSVPEELEALLLRTHVYQYQITTINEPGTWYGNQRVFEDWVEAYKAALYKSQTWALVDEVRVVPA
ncbi:DUF3846 domain-containing protein [Glutamicibacter halophytocola]|uniref:DUF3846 domain-containing protein n=1 Tax=Glutamicibacter halophytocola TaxID=1933880 RepID=UPI0026573D5E|nr:DUF3846 domain-containing protein [Glutamicibacter halophytocola]